MRLFKYFSSDRLQILENRLIRFSPPSAFNDPFEFLPSIKSIATPNELLEFVKEDAKKRGPELFEQSGLSALGVSEESFNNYLTSFLSNAEDFALQMMKAAIPRTQQTIFDSLNNNVGVLCLSEKNDDLLMWAHYADCHKGFVVEFDADSSFFNRKLSDKDSFRHLRKVRYNHRRPAVTLTDTNDEEIFLTKSSHWEYEAEWRIMLPLADADSTVTVRGEVVSLFEVPLAAIKSVIFGAKFPESLSNDTMESLSFLEGYESLEFYKARIHLTDYSVVIEPAWPTLENNI